MQGGPANFEGHPRRWVILGVLVSAVLVVILDNTILNVALPSMERELSASQSQQEWMVDAYTLTFAGFMFAAGVSGDRFGRRRRHPLRPGAIRRVQPGLLVCRPRAYLVIACRAVMGIGGAAVVPTTLSIISNVFDDAERPRAISVWAGLSGASVAAGPIVGGLLLSHFWWGSVFLVNVPVSIVAIVLILRWVPESRDPDSRRIQPLAGAAVGRRARARRLRHHQGRRTRRLDELAGDRAADRRAGLAGVFVWRQSRAADAGPRRLAVPQPDLCGGQLGDRVDDVRAVRRDLLPDVLSAVRARLLAAAGGAGDHSQRHRADVLQPADRRTRAAVRNQRRMRRRTAGRGRCVPGHPSRARRYADLVP